MVKLPPNVSYIFIEAKGFILRCEPLDAITPGHVGVNAFFRDPMFYLSKTDKLEVRPAAIKSMSPLESIELSVETKILRKENLEFDKDGRLKLDEEMIG